MDKVWSISVKVPQGYQWWHVEYDAEADARIAIAKACPEAEDLDGNCLSLAIRSRLFFAHAFCPSCRLCSLIVSVAART